MISDKQGRPYARLSRLKPGDQVIVDDGFPCMMPWQQLTIHEHGKDLWLKCRGPDGLGKPLSEKHGLDGQLAEDGDTLIGIYHKGDV